MIRFKIALLVTVQAQIALYEARNTPPVSVSAAAMKLQRDRLSDHMKFEMPKFGNGRELRSYQEVRAHCVVGMCGVKMLMTPYKC